jgi:hypothetical protein
MTGRLAHMALSPAVGLWTNAIVSAPIHRHGQCSPPQRPRFDDGRAQSSKETTAKGSRLMNDGDVTVRLAQAEELPDLLDAAYEAFAAMLTIIEEHQNPDSRFFVPMVYAAASAANGRDHIIRAPSLPPSPAHQAEPKHQRMKSEDDQAAANWIAALCRNLERRLTTAAAEASESGDQRACAGAAGYAREIAILMGHQPE